MKEGMKESMTEKPVPEEPELVACEVCLKEIPKSVAMSSEADEYAQHFCGLTCYKQWRSSQEHDSGQQTQDKAGE